MKERGEARGAGRIRRLGERLTYSNVMATIAVVVALGGGTAWALQAGSVKSRHIKNNAVAFKDLKSVKAWKRNVPVSATAPDPADSRAAASRVVLARRGSLTIFGKCHKSTTNNWVHSDVYVRTAKNGALTARLEGWEQIQRLNKGTPESVDGGALASANTFEFSDPRFERLLLSGDGKLALNLRARSVAKNGTPPQGNAPLGAGDRCLFAGYVIG